MTSVEKGAPPNLRARAITAGVILAYLALGAALALTKAPYGDEGYCAAPSYTLITKGYMGIPGITDFGVDRHLYSQPPLYFLAQAAWYRVVGFSVFTMRFSNALWGLALIALLYSILKRVTGERGLALLAGGLLAIDYTFLMGASTARADMMAAALGVAAIACYLHLNKQNLGYAVLASQALVTLSGLTHPVAGILAAVALLAVTLASDGSRALRPQYVLLAVLPYLVGAAGWALYIMQNPADFKAQFLGIALSMDRGRALHSPISALISEFTDRYWKYYGFTGGVKGLRPLLTVGYLTGIFCAVLVPSMRRRPQVRAVAGLCGLLALTLSLVDGTKQLQYLLHLTPLFVSLLAMSLWYLRVRWPVIAVLVVLQLGPVLFRVRADPYMRAFVPATAALRPYVEAGSAVMADPQFAIPFRFPQNIQSDIHYGFRTGRRPDVIQIDDAVFQGNLGILTAKDPAEGAYLRRLVSEDSLQVWEGGGYRIYVRR